MSRKQRQGFSEILGGLLIRIWEFLSDNRKKVMPVILLICVFATIGIAIHANRVAAEQAISDADKNESSRPSSFEVTQAALMQDAYPEINSLISDYFDAYVSGNVAKLNSGLYRTLDEIETVTLEERAKYIQSVRNLTVYTKPGPVEDSWVAYAYTDVRYMGCEEDLPGMVAFYICKDEDGTYYINADETTQSVKDYITAVNLQDDVVELYNRVNVEYADKLKEDQMFAELVAAIYAEIDESIGERLTGADAAVAAAEAANAEAGNAGGEGNGTAAGEDDTPKEVKIRATTTVRVRKSDSTESEVLGKAEAGEEFVRISEQGNGWSKISFAGGAAFVKSEFFEVLDAEPAGIPVNTGANAATTATTAAAEATTQAAAASASTNAGTGASNAATGASTAAGTGSTVAASGNASTGKSASSANASTGRSTASANASTAKSTSSANASTGKSNASTGKSDASTGKSAASSNASTGKSSASNSASTGSTAKPISSTGKKIARNGVRMRGEPNTEATILYTLYGGVEVEVTKIRDDDWSEVKYKGKKGYIKTEYLSDP